MKREYNIPKDSPAACCARCMWYKCKLDKDGFAQCLMYREKRYYKCMVCPEYELDPERDMVGNGG